MAASRIQIPLVVQISTEAEAGGKPVVVGGKNLKLTVPVYKAKVKISRRDSVPVKVYQTESGAEIGTELETDENGQIKAWVPEGPYLLTAEGGEPSIVKTEYTWDALTGRGVEQTSEHAVALVDLITTVQASLVPVGTVLAYAGKAGSPPTGFFTCDGSKKLKESYETLYSKIGTEYGPVETIGGKEYFTIPKGTTKNSEGQIFVNIIRYE